MNKIYLYQFLELLEKENYKVVDNLEDIINFGCTTFINCECPKGHQYKTYWSGWNQGRRCYTCGKNKLKTPYDVVQKDFNDEGYAITYPNEKEYDYFKIKSEKIQYICSNGHSSCIKYSDWRLGQRCKQCFEDRRTFPYEKIYEMFKERGYTIITPTKETYKSTDTGKITYRCKNGHTHSIYYRDFKKGHGCSYCAGLTKKTFEEVKESFERENYVVLTKKEDYKNNKSMIDFICPHNHTHSIRVDMFMRGIRCGKCDVKWSIEEKELAEYIQSLNIEIVENDRKLISPKEIDILIPSKKIAIEYCGLYWHGENNEKDKTYHLTKYLLCKEQGYNLITIFEDEWKNKKNILKNKLKILLGINDNITHERKFNIREINPIEAKLFIDEHHLEGYSHCDVNLGAFTKKNELISVMSFSKPSILKRIDGNDFNYIWKLDRCCSSKQSNVVYSNILEHFKSNYQWNKIYSISYNRFCEDGLYENMRMEYVNDIKPTFHYFLKNSDIKRYNRFEFKKSLLKDKLNSYDENKNEYQNMLYNGYDRIWDCGGKLFMLKI